MSNRDRVEAFEKQSKQKDSAFNSRHKGFKPGGDISAQGDGHTRAKQGERDFESRDRIDKHGSFKPDEVPSEKKNSLNELSRWKSGDPLPQADKAEINQSKFERYSMDPANENNNGKWKAFESLGFNVRSESGRKVAAQDVVAQLREKLPNSSATEGKTSPYGLRFVVRSELRGPNGKEGTLVSVWQVERGSKTPRIITNWLEVYK
jgi:hypothetical protein